MMGILLMSVGLSYALESYYRSAPLPEIAFDLTLQPLGWATRAAVSLTLGITAVSVALLPFVRSLLAAAPRR